MAVYEVQPLTVEPKNIFKSLWYTYIREMKKPKSISIAPEIKEELRKMKWGKYEGFITDGQKGYYLRYPESMSEEIIDELNELNDDYLRKCGIVMPYTPAEKYEWEAQNIDNIAEWIDGITEFVSANEAVLMPVAMKKLPFTNAAITKKVISLLRGVVLIVSSIIIGRFNGNRIKMLEAMEKLPDRDSLFKAISHTYLSPAKRLVYAIDPYLEELKKELAKEDTDVGLLIGTTINNILNEIDANYVDAFANAVSALKGELWRRRNYKKENKDNPSIPFLMEAFGEMVENLKKKQDEDKPQVIEIPESEVVSSPTETPIHMLKPVRDHSMDQHPVIDPFPQYFSQTEPAAHSMVQHMQHIPDPTDNVVQFRSKPIVARAKPEFVVDGANKTKEGIPQNIPEEFVSSINNVDPSIRKYFQKNLWALKIHDIAVSKGLKMIIYPEVDISGNLIFMKFVVSREEALPDGAGAIERVVDDKSFRVDIGQVINRDYNIWPCFQNGDVTPVELCDVAYRLFKRNKPKRDIDGVNYEFIEKIFTVGFSSLNKKDVDGVIAFSPDILARNRLISLITLPNDKGKVDLWRGMATKIAMTINGFEKMNYNDPTWHGTDLTKYRFAVRSYDHNDLSMTLTTRGVPKYLMIPEEPKQSFYEIYAAPSISGYTADGIPNVEFDDSRLPVIQLTIAKNPKI